MGVDELTENLEEIIYSEEFIIDNFSTKDSFYKWLDLGTKRDIECAREALLGMERYEHIIWLDEYVENKFN